MTRLRIETPEIPPTRGRPTRGMPQADGHADGAHRPCAIADCAEHGLYPAPRSRDDLRDYIWLCLDHVRDYNRNWNYFEGCDADAMEDAIRASTTWERPSWKFSRGGHACGRTDSDSAKHFDDVFGIFGNGNGHGRDTPAEPADPAEARAWKVFGLPPGSDMDAVKKRYKQLAKRHHPDANGGSRKAEDKLKTINEAYSVLKKRP